MRFVVVTAALSLLLAACPERVVDGAGEGEGEGEEGEGEGEGEAGEGEGEGPVDGGPLDTCTSNAECLSGTCTSFFDGDFANDFCTDVCETDVDCDFGDQDSFCLLLGATGICFPVCGSTADCGGLDGDVSLGTCFTNPDNPNLCFSLNGSGFCEDGSACQADEACTLVGTGLKFEFVCSPSVAGDVGEACDATALERRGRPCEAVADCPSGFACVDEDAADGPNAGARVCSASEALNCGAFVCWSQGFCAGACDADDDCPDDWRCETFDFGQPELVQLCRPAAGSGAPCAADDDCTVEGESCSLHNDDNGDLVAICTLPSAGDSLPGGDCGDDGTTPGTVEPTTGCTSNVCSDFGTCSVLCEADTDCGANACLLFEVGNQDPEQVFGVCGQGPRCENDVDCGTGGLCTRTTGPEGSVGICIFDVGGALQAGAVCDEVTNFNLLAGATTCFNDGDCVTAANNAGYVCDLGSNSCRPPFAEVCQGGCFFDHCLQNCANTADCANAGADFVCSGDEEVVDENDPAIDTDDETDDFGLCIFLPGTRTPCGSTSDCTTVGEVCNIVVERETLAVQTVCTSRQGDAEFGEPCGQLGDNFVQCDDVCARDPDTGVATCRTVCDATADCPGDLVCRAFDLRNDRSALLCQPAE